MVTYKCKTCGGQMEFEGSGGFTCPYCGNKTFFSDADFKGNEEFRKKLLQYYKAAAENKENDYSADTFWCMNGTDSYFTEDGQELRIEYMKQYPCDGYVCYLAKESVVYVFDSASEAAVFQAGLNRLSFPAADVRLHRSFPELKLELALTGGGKVLAFRRRPMVYPAEMFAPYASEHLAWVISRMENICCTLAYSGIEHGDISPCSVWVNPMLHEGTLFGDWRRVRSLQSHHDLVLLRKTAIGLAQNTRKPMQLYFFLNTSPAADAYTDFEKWDRVIESGFGGHKFVKMC